MDWVISDELSLTIGNIVGWVSAGAMIVGGVVPYIPQYKHIKKTQDAEGFSLYVCLALLVANTLRIFFWFGKRFEYPLLIQSVIMNITMLAMVHLCVRIKNKNKILQARRVFTANPEAANRISLSQSIPNPKPWRSSHSICELDRKYFWAWTDFQSYLDCMVIFAIICALIMYFMINIKWFVEVVGFLAVFTEAMLGVPQLVRNHKSRSTIGMRDGIVVRRKRVYLGVKGYVAGVGWWRHNIDRSDRLPPIAILLFAVSEWSCSQNDVILFISIYNTQISSNRCATRRIVMASRSKEKVAAAFRKLFRASDKLGEPSGAAKGGGSGGGGGGPVAGGSPGRRLLRGYRDAVSPAGGSLPSSPANSGNTSASSVNKKKSTTTSASCEAAAAVAAAKTVRARRLMKELKEIQRLQTNRPDPVFTVELVNDNLFEWHVRLLRVDPESELASDMRELAIPCILLHIVFPENFPFAPPFMRVISPRIEKGFVMEGGAICMELLTPRGWASAYTVEAVVMQFAASIVKGQGRVARKAKGAKDFSRRSAEESFRSLVKTHEKYGWVTPALSDG